MLLVFICLRTLVIAQSNDDSDTGTVHITVDKRMDLLTNTPPPVAEKKVNKSQIVKGYRIQVYYGTSRQEAADAKMMFMKKYPRIRSYLTYSNPQYRLKVGDFKSRAEADAFADGLQGMFKSFMIVNENINVVNSRKN